MKPSAQAVLELLRSRPDGVTGLEALYAGCGDRLPARIGELKAAGYHVTDRWETTPNGARVKRFRLVKERFVPIRGEQESFADWAPGELAEAFGR